MKFDVTLSQYERIYKIVASVGRELSHGEGKSCQFYNVTGALLLEKIYKVKARPVMGAAFIKLTESGDVLFLLRKKVECSIVALMHFIVGLKPIKILLTLHLQNIGKL